MRYRLNLFVLLILLLSPAAWGASSPFGVNLHAPQGEELAAQLDKTRAAGIGWVRIDFIWAVAEPVRGKYDWRIYDAIAAAAKARGLQVFATIAYTPGWATDGPASPGVTRNPDEWRRL